MSNPNEDLTAATTAAQTPMEGEAAVIAEAAAEAAAAAAAAAAALPGAPAPAAAPAPAPAEAPAAAAPAPVPSVFVPSITVTAPVDAEGKPRDFDAELATLAKQYEDGNIELGPFLAQTRAIEREQTTFNVLTSVDKGIKDSAAAHQKSIDDQANNDFATAQAAWFNDAENAKWKANPVALGALQQAINVLDDPAKGGFRGSPTDLLNQARDMARTTLSDAIGLGGKRDAQLSGGADPSGARTSDTTGIPPALARAPGGGVVDLPTNDVDRAFELPIEQLEQWMAQNPTAADKLLEATPGATTYIGGRATGTVAGSATTN